MWTFEGSAGRTTISQWTRYERKGSTDNYKQTIEEFPDD